MRLVVADCASLSAVAVSSSLARRRSVTGARGARGARVLLGLGVRFCVSVIGVVVAGGWGVGSGRD